MKIQSEEGRVKQRTPKRHNVQQLYKGIQSLPV